MNLSKRTKREKNMIYALIVIALVAGTYFFFTLWFTPQNAKAEELRAELPKKETELKETEERYYKYLSLTQQSSSLSVQWEELFANLPAYFDDLDIVSRINIIFLPYARDVKAINFPGTGKNQVATTVYSINLNFISSYDTLQYILDLFQKETLYNRIVKLSYQRDDEGDLAVSMTVEFLTALAK